MTDGSGRFSFCPKCGGGLSLFMSKGRYRSVCNDCGYIFYANPIVGVAVILQGSDGSVLLGRRSAGSTYPGVWCIPCGYVEYDEEVREAARREFLEETGLEVEIGPVFTVLSNFHNPETHTVGIWFLSQMTGGFLQAGDDLDEVAWFLPGNMPVLAFPSDNTVLEMLKSKTHD